MNKLSERLEAISKLIPKNSRIIDIGCDHGLLDVYLYQQKICEKIIASDINESALKNAIENIKKNNLEKYIDTRLGDGLNILKDEDKIDTIVISGLGSTTIIEILNKNIQKLKNINTIIIQSNTNLENLRKKIIKLNYFIEDEKIVKDRNKLYIIIKFQKGNKKYSKKDLYFGPILLKENSKLFQEYLKENLKRLIAIRETMPKRKIFNLCKIKKEINLYKNI